MGHVAVTLNGRSYRFACGDGEEARLHDLAAHVKSKVDTLALQFGQVGEDRLFLMAALLVADELFEARERTGQPPAAASLAPESAGAGKPSEPAPRSTPQPAAKLSGKSTQPSVALRKPHRTG